MKTFTAVIEKCVSTGFYVGHVPGILGAHSQGKTLEELNSNLVEVLEMLVEDEIEAASEFFDTHVIRLR